MGRMKDLFLEEQQRRMEELDERYQNHDCHASPMDGCAVCAEYQEAVDNRQVCPQGICDGSGRITEGQFDDIRDRDCLCEVERKLETEPNNQD